ncbi:MAG: isoamylase early set domain-containing protein [Chitinophagaceae bacterium]|nr:isoamylase early set domain-containing protein [Chitinophagaceae bacterium]
MVTKTYYKTKDYCKVKFSFNPENATAVSILGLNGKWEEAIPMNRKKDGSFSADVNLPKDSRHEFKYLVNSTEWMNDPEADGQAPNQYGGTNSVVLV